MRPEIAALMASAATTPWAIRREVLDSFRASPVDPGALIGMLQGRGLAIGAHLTEPVTFSIPGSVSAADEPNAAVSPATERAVARQAGGVAVIPVRGTISARLSWFDLLFGAGATPPGWIVGQVTRAVQDDAIKAVVLDFDSPGGVVTGVQEAFAAIFALRGKKPIIAQVSGQMASAAYWIGCAADEIAATETALVGSLGVYMTHDDWSKFYEEMGLVRTYIQEGKNKTEGNDSEPLSEEAFAHIQELCGDYMKMFMGAVAKGRGQPEALVRGERFGQGRVYTAARAVERGMADKVRDLSATLAAYGVNAPTRPSSEGNRRTFGLLDREIEALALEAS